MIEVPFVDSNNFAPGDAPKLITSYPFYEPQSGHTVISAAVTNYPPANWCRSMERKEDASFVLGFVCMSLLITLLLWRRQ